MHRRDPDLPVAHKIVSAGEAMDRMQVNSSYSPAYFENKECYYVRFHPTPSVNQDFDLNSGALSCILKHVPLHGIVCTRLCYWERLSPSFPSQRDFPMCEIVNKWFMFGVTIICCQSCKSGIVPWIRAFDYLLNDLSDGKGLKQALKLWVSPKGAISPLHFDGGTSCLVQVSNSCTKGITSFAWCRLGVLLFDNQKQQWMQSWKWRFKYLENPDPIR